MPDAPLVPVSARSGWAYPAGQAREGASGSAGRTESTSCCRAQANDDLLRGLARGPQAGKGDVMTDLPARPDLDQLRHQAKDLLRAAQAGDPQPLPGSGRCLAE
jgi:hypothetical protein